MHDHPSQSVAAVAGWKSEDVRVVKTYFECRQRSADTAWLAAVPDVLQPIFFLE